MSASATAACAPKCRVLVADDHGDIAGWMAMLLRTHGFEVEAVGSGAEALRVAAIFHPQVALLDLGMPGIDGYQTAVQMRAQPWGKSPKLIATTGWGEPEDIARSRAAGFDHHLVKPVEPEKLLALLAALAQ